MPPYPFCCMRSWSASCFCMQAIYTCSYNYIGIYSTVAEKDTSAVGQAANGRQLAADRLPRPTAWPRATCNRSHGQPLLCRALATLRPSLAWAAWLTLAGRERVGHARLGGSELPPCISYNYIICSGNNVFGMRQTIAIHMHVASYSYIHTCKGCV